LKNDSLRVPLDKSAVNALSPYRIALFAVLFLELLFVRRAEQLLNPQVWVEDGRVVLHGLITEGARSLIEPVNGYLIAIARLISSVALSITFVHYPLVSTILAWLFIVAVVLAISFSPTILRGGVLLGVLTMLVPSDAEVFGLPLYTIWWAALLIFLAALWQYRRGGFAWRIAFVLVGGLSSPAIFLALPLFLVRAWFVRGRQEIVVTLVALACGIIQFQSVRLDPSATSTTNLTASIRHCYDILPKFIGDYLVGNFVPQTGALAITAGVITIVTVLAALLLNVRDVRLYAVCYLWAGAVALSVARVDIAVADAAKAGQRYFFLPFVFEAWLLLQIAFSARQRPLRIVATVMLVLATANMLPVLRRAPADDLHWAANVTACAASPDDAPFIIPIEFNGDAKLAWKLRLTGALCRAQLHRSLVDRL
jgi:hypothetical protein